MRQHYQLLRDALTTLDNVAMYLFEEMPNHPALGESLGILKESRRLIREELKHPERFNLDGTKREVLLYDSAKKGPYVKVA